MELHTETEVDEIINDEYIPRLFAPYTGDWLYNCSNALSKRKIPSPEDTGINGEFLGI